MNFSFLIQYAVPTIFLAGIVAILGSTGIADSLKFTIYGICLVGTFVFKAFVDKKFKKNETAALEKEKITTLKKISTLESRVEELEYEIHKEKIDHTQTLHQIERNLNRHLTTNTKCAENLALWSGMERTLNQIAKMSDTALEKSKENSKSNKRTNKK